MMPRPEPVPAASRPVRLAIVEDSASMRMLIRRIVEAEGGFEVVGEASDPYEAREMIKATAPDVVTLDIEMPRMNGLDFLEKIMRLRPMPVVMVSSLTDAGCDATVTALSLGAVDCVAKPSGDNTGSFLELPAKIRAAAGAKVSLGDAPRNRPAPLAWRPFDKIVAIGASTGGVEALIRVLSAFPEDCPPTLLVQHMPRAFTTSFARRLDAVCAAEVREAQDGAPIVPDRIYLAPGSDVHLEAEFGAVPCCCLSPAPPESGHRPSVDVLFRSLASRAPGVVAAVLTGMGTDGAEGLGALRDAGCPTFVQDRASCVVFGMPRAALDLGAAEAETPLAVMAERVLDAAQVSA